MVHSKGMAGTKIKEAGGGDWGDYDHDSSCCAAVLASVAIAGHIPVFFSGGRAALLGL
jgi:hypothetical protein